MRNNLLAGVAMTQAELSQGRYMRAPDGHEPNGDGGNASQSGTQNNQGGNSSDSGQNAGSDENNSGHPKVPDEFWKEPEAPKGGEGESNKGSDENKEYTQQFAGRLEKIPFKPVFNAEISDQIAQNDFKGVNDLVQQNMRESVRQSVIMSAELMQKVGGSILAQVKEMIQGSHAETANEQTLLEAFPSARDPKARPLIEQTFRQSLKHTGGDRDKAIALTRDMLKVVGGVAAKDFGFETPPSGREDYLGDGASSLVEELLARK